MWFLTKQFANFNTKFYSYTVDWEFNHQSPTWPWFCSLSVILNMPVCYWILQMHRTLRRTKKLCVARSLFELSSNLFNWYFVLETSLLFYCSKWLVNTKGKMAKTILMWCCLCDSLRLVSVTIIFILAVIMSDCNRVQATRKQNCDLKCSTYDYLNFNTLQPQYIKALIPHQNKPIA